MPNVAPGNGRIIDTNMNGFAFHRVSKRSAPPTLNAAAVFGPTCVRISIPDFVLDTLYLHNFDDDF